MSMKLYSKLSTQQWIIVALTLVAALVHLFLPGVIFLLNGLGYLGLLVLYFVKFDFLPIPRNWIRWALAGYAALTAVIYVVMQIQSGGEFVSALGIVTLLVELVLIFLLAKEKV
jgi:hypothetical protein